MRESSINHSPRAAAPVPRVRANRLRRITSRDDWAGYLARYRNGEYRARIFFDMVLEDVRDRLDDLTLLDIGCGRGFDGDPKLQQALTQRCSRFIGLEPDQGIPVGQLIPEVHRYTLEQAPLPAGCVDIAFAVMVLEHLPTPRAFFSKLWTVLKDGGVFWGFTVDGRHFFAHLSRWADLLGIKEKYLGGLLGERGSQRYESYPAFYRANTPRQIAPHVARFRRFDFFSFLRVGENDDCIPRWLHPMAHAVDRLMMALALPGSTLAIRLEK